MTPTAVGMLAQVLAKKMIAIMELSQQQLSKQDHYDYGLRSFVIPIARAAGKTCSSQPGSLSHFLMSCSCLYLQSVAGSSHHPKSCHAIILTKMVHTCKCDQMLVSIIILISCLKAFQLKRCVVENDAGGGRCIEAGGPGGIRRADHVPHHAGPHQAQAGLPGPAPLHGFAQRPLPWS